MEKKDSPKERRKVLAGELRRRDLDGALISNPKHIFYLTGFASNLNFYLTLMKGPRSTSFLFVDEEGGAHLLVGGTELANPWSSPLDTGKAGKNDLDLLTYDDYKLDERMISYADTVAAEMTKWMTRVDLGLHGRKKRGIGIEEWHLPSIFRSAVMRGGGWSEDALANISELLISMRRTKGKDEVSNLVEATKILDHAYGVAKEHARAGETELDVSRAINRESFKRYGPFAWVIGDIISGERSLAVGGWPTERRMEKGDTLVMDLQVAHNNYWSDLCRTFVIGGPSTSQEKVLELLVSAKGEGEALLRPRTRGSEIYRAVSTTLSKTGQGLIHHAGHCIGLDDQESPWFIPNSDDELEEAAVCVLEPGVYQKKTGGMRIEDSYVITRAGFEKISSFPLDL